MEYQFINFLNNLEATALALNPSHMGENQGPVPAYILYGADGSIIAQGPTDGSITVFTEDILPKDKSLVYKAVLNAPITTIDDDAFSCCSNITSIAIPDSVTSIGDSAFASCSSLTNIKIPNSVTHIGNLAFGECSNLATANVPEGLTIPDDAFPSTTKIIRY